MSDEIRRQRMAGLYEDDRDQKRRCSHDNPEIKRIYTEFLGEPLSERAHHLLHTTYDPKQVYLK